MAPFGVGFCGTLCELARMSRTSPRAGTPSPATDDREYLRLVAEATPIAIVAVDNRGQITLANTEAQLIGYS